MKNSDGGRLVILTLKKHREGIWIRKLVERLESIKVQVAATKQNCNDHNNYQIEVRTLEDWLASGWLVSDTLNQQVNHNDILGIVNRVSDAASPALYKACCAVLHYFQSLRIPVWNGSKAYSLCGNKWMHHLLFRRANLSAPTTMSYWIGDDDGDNDREEEMTEEKTTYIDTSIFRQDDITGTTQLLIKPNAGGFGAGIKKISIPLPSSSSLGDDAIYTKQGMVKISIPSSYEDCMALIQQYEQPRDRKLYRVWFLNGKIQCAVERQIGKETEYDDDTSSAEFTSGCASGGVCTLSDASSRRNKIIKQNNGSSSSSSDQNHGNKYETTNSLSQKLSNNHTVTTSPLPSESLHSSPSPSSSPRMVAWKVPNEVRQEIEDRLLPLLEDAHSGSIEFLYTSLTLSNEKNAASKGSSGSEEVSSSWPRLYFDLNLLSTLPVFDDDEVTEEDGGGKFWSNDYDPSYDPWHELAHSIWEFCITTSIAQPRG